MHFHVDRVGLLLDMDRQTLTVYRDGKKVGVMVRPGMANPRGKPIAPLVGPLRWAVDVCGERDSEVAIERQPLPAEPKPAEVVASLRAHPSDVNVQRKGCGALAEVKSIA